MNTPTTPDTEDASAWYRQPTVWLVLGILGFTIVSSFALLFIATSNPPDLIDKAPVRIEAPNAG